MRGPADIARAAVTIGHTAWARWPRPGVFSRIPRGPRADAPRPRARAPRHRWVRVSGLPVTGTYQCTLCQRKARSLSIKTLMAVCKGASGREGYRRIMVTPQGHRLVAVYPGAGDAAPFLACVRCGAWSTGRPVKLAQPCCGPTTSGRAGIRRMARGMHPGNRSAVLSILWIRDGAVTDDAVQFS